MPPKKVASKKQSNQEKQADRRTQKKEKAKVGAVPVQSKKQGQGKPTSAHEDDLWSPWLNVDAQLCTSCKQTTHDLDKDAPEDEPRYLKWVRKNVRGDGTTLPGGHECYECYRVRDVSFNAIALDELEAQRMPFDDKGRALCKDAATCSLLEACLLRASVGYHLPHDTYVLFMTEEGRSVDIRPQEFLAIGRCHSLWYEIEGEDWDAMTKFYRGDSEDRKWAKSTVVNRLKRNRASASNASKWEADQPDETASRPTLELPGSSNQTKQEPIEKSEKLRKRSRSRDRSKRKDRSVSRSRSRKAKDREKKQKSDRSDRSKVSVAESVKQMKSEIAQIGESDPKKKKQEVAQSVEQAKDAKPSESSNKSEVVEASDSSKEKVVEASDSSKGKVEAVVDPVTACPKTPPTPVSTSSKMPAPPPPIPVPPKAGSVPKIELPKPPSVPDRAKAKTAQPVEYAIPEPPEPVVRPQPPSPPFREHKWYGGYKVFKPPAPKRG